ncbi:MAG TPA: MsnO8 family LLM class oxidoreductase, partial [Acidimicrobiales bacterium]
AADLGSDTFPDDVVELINYLLPREGAPQHPSPTPGTGYLPEVWLLGSSTYSAQLAGMLGLPFSFAYHFAPDLLDSALSLYRSTFRPSVLLDSPYAMVAVSVICAPTVGEARWLAGSTALSILQRRTGHVGLLPSPEEADVYPFTAEDVAMIEGALASHVIGDQTIVREGLIQLQQRTSADELMISTRTHSYDARARSFALIAEAWELESVTT